MELSPFKLPLKAGIIACEDSLFEGLFGVFNDSLPDGWGRLLLDRKLMQLGLRPQTLTPLERLCYVGSQGMGALQYFPEIKENMELHHFNDLDFLSTKCFLIQEKEENQYLDDFLVMNGSSAGARPKILIRLLNKKGDFESTQNSKLPSTNSDWIVKFHSSSDPKDIGSIEYAYHLMAKECGLNVPEAKLFKSKKCPGYFGVKRFDRLSGKCVHMHSICGLLHADHRFPSLDYESILKVTLSLTKNTQQCEAQFRQAVFNVLAHNRDDHSKNFSFLMDENGVWQMSPSYDLTFSYGPGGEHCTTIMGEGKRPTLLHLKKLAKIIGLNEKNIISIVEQVKSVVAQWPQIAKSAHVSKTSLLNIQKELNANLSNFSTAT